MKRKEKSKGSLGLLDLVLLLLLAVGAVALGVRAYTRYTRESVSESATFLAVLDSGEVDPLMADSFAVGERLYLQNGSLFGKIMEIEKVPLSITLFSNGTAYTGAWDPSVRCRLHITVQCTGVLRNGSLLIGGKQPLGIGETVVPIGYRSEQSFRLLRISEQAQ